MSTSPKVRAPHQYTPVCMNTPSHPPRQGAPASLFIPPTPPTHHHLLPKPQALDIEAGGSGAAARPAKPPSRPSPRAGATTTGGGSGGGGEDVRKTVRQSLGFPGALELVLLLSITSVIFSIACCSANSSGWFISKTGGKDDGLRSTTNVGWARYKSDINDIW